MYPIQISQGVKILCVLYLHYNVVFTFKWYWNFKNKMLYFVWIGYNIEPADLVNENSFILFWSGKWVSYFLVEEFSQYFILWKLSLLTPLYRLEVVNSNGDNTKQYLEVNTEPCPVGSLWFAWHPLRCAGVKMTMIKGCIVMMRMSSNTWKLTLSLVRLEACDLTGIP